MITRSKSRGDIALIAVAGIYLIILLVLLFGKSIPDRAINVIPFAFVRDYLIDREVLAFSNVIGNVIMFIPFGVYLPLLSGERSLRLNLSAVIAFSVAAELLQFIFKAGVTDIDDVLLNTVGGLIGIVCCRALLARSGDDTRRIVISASVIIGALFVILSACLYFGVFGIRIRIF